MIISLAGLMVHLLAAGWFLWSARPLSRGASWSKEGTWLRENTPPYTRITTDEKALFVYARRFQRTLSLQGVGLEELNQALVSNGAGYLAVSGWNDKPMLWANPAFVFRRVTVTSDIARQIKLWEVQPNFLGTALAEPPLAADAISYDESENLLASHELLLREAQHMHSMGRLPEAERMLRQLLGPTPPHAPDATPVWVELGNLLLHAGRPQEAIDCYQRGMGGQTSDAYRLQIVSGLAVAERFARAADESVPAAERAALLAEIAAAHARMARWVPARETVERAIQLDRDFVNGRLLHVLMLRRLGKTTLALQAIDTVLDVLRAQFPDVRLRAAQPVHRNAIEQLFLIRVPEILEGEQPVDVALDEETISVDPGDPTAYTRIVELLLRDGLPGVALRTLQTGTARHPNDGHLWLTLGNVWMAFGRFQEAKDCFSRAEQLGLRRQAAPGLVRLAEFLESRPIQ